MEKFDWEKLSHITANLTFIMEKEISKQVSQPEMEAEFSMYIELLKQSLNPNVTKQKAVGMLVQHIITRKIYDIIYKGYHFVKNNSVSKYMQHIVEMLDMDSLRTILTKEKEIADAIKNLPKLSNIGMLDSRILFQNVFMQGKQPASEYGIFNVPLQCVDFALRMVSEILQKEFDTTLSEPDNQLFDPFIGCGVFFSRLILGGYISKKSLPRKYREEMFCSELALTPYYLADVNIEYAYHAVMSELPYEFFNGIRLADTFNLYEQGKSYFDFINEQRFEFNPDSVRILIGHIPTNENIPENFAPCNAENYPRLDLRISQSFNNSGPEAKSVPIDEITRAYRYGADCISDGVKGGILTLVGSSDWLSLPRYRGMRRCLENEFAAIYIVTTPDNMCVTVMFRKGMVSMTHTTVKICSITTPYDFNTLSLNCDKWQIAKNDCWE